MMMMMNNEDEDEYTYSETATKKRKSKNKRRFSDEQIKSLETIFESESKLEPRKKLQLARELGLQPRQVAIWFQNKRARYKSKQLEHEYGALRADYNNLASQFETVKKEKQALQVQLQKLNDQMKKTREGNQTDGGDEAKSKLESKPAVSDDDSSVKAESFRLNNELRPSFSLEISHNKSALSDENSSIKTEYFGLDEEPELLNILDPADSTLTSPENWGSLESGSSYQWWDVWS